MCVKINFSQLFFLNSSGKLSEETFPTSCICWANISHNMFSFSFHITKYRIRNILMMIIAIDQVQDCNNFSASNFFFKNKTAWMNSFRYKIKSRAKIWNARMFANISWPSEIFSFCASTANINKIKNFRL